MATEERTTGTVVAIGDPAALAGYALAGVQVLPAPTAPQALAVWEALPGGVALALVTEAAAQALGDRLSRPGAPLSAVIPR